MKERTRQTMNRFRIRVIAFVVVFAMALSAAASMPMDVFAAKGDFVISNGVLTKYTGSDSNVTIPDGIKKIGTRAFFDCRNLITVKISSSVVSVDSEAFSYCFSLKNVTISDSVTTIGDRAFYDCFSIEEIKIPKNVSSIGTGVFSYCRKLKEINVDQGNTKYTSENGVLFDYRKTKLICYPAGKTDSSYKIPTSVTSTEQYSFCGSSNLINVNLPDSLKLIGEASFEGCKGLKIIKIPKSVTAIGGEDFDGCDSSNVFGSCSSLGDIDVDKNNMYYSSLNGVLFNKTKTELLKYPAGKTDSVYSVPKTVSAIGKLAFEACPNLKTVNLTDSVCEIKKRAFQYCSFSEITIPKSVKTIGYCAFYHYDKPLKDVYYLGTEYEWKQVWVNGYGNDNLFNAVFHFASYDSRPFSIDEQPENTGIRIGEYVSISVSATGDDLKYQWYYKKAGMSEWSIWEGKTDNYFGDYPDSSWNGMKLFCKVKDYYGRTLDSNTITVTIKPDIEILEQPKNCFVKRNEPASIGVVVEGKGFNYTWYYKKSEDKTWKKVDNYDYFSSCIFVNESGCVLGDSWTELNSTIQFTASEDFDGMQAYCSFTDTANNKTYKSDTVTVKLIDTVLSIVSHPENKFSDVNASVSFSVIAQGEGLTYQWYYKKSDQVAWNKWEGKTSATITATANSTWNGMQVFCKVTDKYGNIQNSNIATITVSSDPEERLFGDANGDGKVNGKDATRLMQYLAGWDVEIGQSAADVNGDGKINGKDATRLMQYLAGWDVTIG